MLLNRVEKTLMNNPIRAAIQRRFEMPRLLDMGGVMKGGVALEIGCGRGVGTELILELAGADRVDAFDLDPRMVGLAARRLRRFGDRVRLRSGDATSIDADAGAYDAVFDFGIIHHIPDWRSAVAEVHRVLAPGGRFYAEEVFAKFILSPVWRRLLAHPMEDRFDHDHFRRGLEEAGFAVRASKQLWGEYGWFIAEK